MNLNWERTKQGWGFLALLWGTSIATGGAATDAWDGAQPSNHGIVQAGNYVGGTAPAAGDTLWFDGANLSGSASTTTQYGSGAVAPSFAQILFSGTTSFTLRNNGADLFTLTGTSGVGLLLQSGSASQTYSLYTGLAGAITFENDSASVLNLATNFADASGSTGSLTLLNGAYNTTYTTPASPATYQSVLDPTSSTYSGGVTLENATWTINVSGTGSSTPFGTGALTLGQSGSANNATLVFTSLVSGTASNAVSNAVNVASGTGDRTIQNGANNEKDFSSAFNLQGSLTLDNANQGASARIALKTPTGGSALSGSGNLLLKGGGSFTLAGTNASFTGATTVSGGTGTTSLYLVSGASIANSAVTVQSGAALGGTGTAGSTTILGGGQLTPGIDGAAGALTFSGDLTLASGSETLLSLTSAGVSTIAATGSISLDGDLVLSLSSDFSGAGVYQLLSAADLSGGFNSVTLWSEGSELGALAESGNTWSGTADGLAASFDQSTGALSLLATPEPGTPLLLLGGGALLLWVVRRRRSAQG